MIDAKCATLKPSNFRTAIKEGKWRNISLDTAVVFPEYDATNSIFIWINTNMLFDKSEIRKIAMFI